MKIKKKYSSVKWYLFFAILASEIILAFSVLGYIVIEPLSITFMQIPVLVCAMGYGPFGGACAGLVFGLTSMWKASVTGTAYADLIFSPIVSHEPVQSIILSVGIRVIFGIASGYMFMLAKRYKGNKTLPLVLAAVGSKLIHSIMIFGCMQLLFPETGAKAINAFTKIETPKNVAEYTAAAVIIVLLFKLGHSAWFQNLVGKLENVNYHYKGHRLRGMLVIFSSILLLISGALLLHFYLRIQILFNIYNIEIEGEAKQKLIQVFLQFQTALVALIAIFGIILVLIVKYSIGLSVKSKKDMMTGVYNRTGVIDCILRMLIHNGGYLIMVDIDNFKKINDTCGHPFGDRIIIEIAKILEKNFGIDKVVGRMGGDEFCVFVEGHISEEELTVCLKKVNQEVAGIDNSQSAAVEIGCSMGIAYGKAGEEFQQIYNRADQALYEVKRNQKNHYRFYS